MSTSKRLDLQTLGSQSVNAWKCPDFLAASLAARFSTDYAQKYSLLPGCRPCSQDINRLCPKVSSIPGLKRLPDTRLQEGSQVPSVPIPGQCPRYPDGRAPERIAAAASRQWTPMDADGRRLTPNQQRRPRTGQELRLQEPALGFFLSFFKSNFFVEILCFVWMNFSWIQTCTVPHSEMSRIQACKQSIDMKFDGKLQHLITTIHLEVTSTSKHSSCCFVNLWCSPLHNSRNLLLLVFTPSLAR